MDNKHNDILKNNKAFPILITLLTIPILILEIKSSRFGTYPNMASRWTLRSNGEILCVIWPLIALLIPLPMKKYRENYWTKTNIIFQMSVFIICLFVLIVMNVNKQYYLPQWDKTHWNYYNSPPIIWNWWKIL